MVYSVDHSDACWYYIDPQVSPVHAPAASLTNTVNRSLFSVIPLSFLAVPSCCEFALQCVCDHQCSWLARFM